MKRQFQINYCREKCPQKSQTGEELFRRDFLKKLKGGRTSDKQGLGWLGEQGLYPEKTTAGAKIQKWLPDGFSGWSEDCSKTICQRIMRVTNSNCHC